MFIFYKKYIRWKLDCKLTKLLDAAKIAEKMHWDKIQELSKDIKETLPSDSESSRDRMARECLKENRKHMYQWNLRQYDIWTEKIKSLNEAHSIVMNAFKTND
jgi:hypothetical protein